MWLKRTDILSDKQRENEPVSEMDFLKLTSFWETTSDSCLYQPPPPKKKR